MCGAQRIFLEDLPSEWKYLLTNMKDIIKTVSEVLQCTLYKNPWNQSTQFYVWVFMASRGFPEILPPMCSAFGKTHFFKKHYLVDARVLTFDAN